MKRELAMSKWNAWHDEFERLIKLFAPLEVPRIDWPQARNMWTKGYAPNEAAALYLAGGGTEQEISR